MSDVKKLKSKAKSRHIGPDADGGYQRHVLVCLGDSCSNKSDNHDTLKAIRKGSKALEKNGGPRTYCTGVDCLQFCKGGPLVVVYPEGTWYHDVDTDVAEKIVESHLGKGQPVTENIITQNPLVKPTEPGPSS